MKKYSIPSKLRSGDYESSRHSKKEEFLNEVWISFTEGIEKMSKADVGKWLAYIVLAFVVAFLLLSFFNQTALQQFIDWTKYILITLVGGGVIIYIIIKVVLKGR